MDALTVSLKQTATATPLLNLQIVTRVEIIEGDLLKYAMMGIGQTDKDVPLIVCLLFRHGFAQAEIMYQSMSVLLDMETGSW